MKKRSPVDNGRPLILLAYCYNTIQIPLSYIHSKLFITILRLQENVPQRVTMAFETPKYSTSNQPSLAFIIQSTSYMVITMTTFL
jgi:hypothetical protein